MFYFVRHAAGVIRCHARRRVCVRSMPPSSSASSSGLMTILSAWVVASGQRNRPFSNRLAQIHRPLPSQNISFKRLCCALQNTNTCPLSGSHPAGLAPSRKALRNLCACRYFRPPSRSVSHFRSRTSSLTLEQLHQLAQSSAIKSWPDFDPTAAPDYDEQLGPLRSRCSHFHFYPPLRFSLRGGRTTMPRQVPAQALQPDTMLVAELPLS